MYGYASLFLLSCLRGWGVETRLFKGSTPKGVPQPTSVLGFCSKTPVTSGGLGSSDPSPPGPPSCLPLNVFYFRSSEWRKCRRLHDRVSKWNPHGSLACFSPSSGVHSRIQAWFPGCKLQKPGSEIGASKKGMSLGWMRGQLLTSIVDGNRTNRSCLGLAVTID